MSKKKEKVEEVTKEVEKAEEKQLSPIEQLQNEVDNLQLELAASKNAYFKAYADADNLKKRLMADAENANKYRIQSFALSILPALDSLELALQDKDLNDSFVKGVKLTYDSIMHALENEGISVIDCLDKPFDSNNAQAMMTDQVEGKEPGIVIEVLQKGYMLKDRLLRAALVKVSE